MNPPNTDAYNCFGAHDAKVTAAGGGLSFYGILSPTYDNHRPFRWSEQDAFAENCMPQQHVGHPDAFDFGWYSFPDVVKSRGGAAVGLRGVGDARFGELPQLPVGPAPLPLLVATVVASICAISLAVFVALGRRRVTAAVTEVYYVSIE